MAWIALQKLRNGRDSCGVSHERDDGEIRSEGRASSVVDLAERILLEPSQPGARALQVTEFGLLQMLASGCRYTSIRGMGVGVREGGILSCICFDNQDYLYSGAFIYLISGNVNQYVQVLVILVISTYMYMLFSHYSLIFARHALLCTVGTYLP